MEQSVSDSSADGSTSGRSARTFLDGLVARLPEPAVVAGADGTVLAANEHLGRLVERSVTGAVGRPLTELFPAATPGRVEAVCGHAGEYVTADCATAEADRWVDLAFERHDAEGETVYLGVGHDVTERQTRERRLEAYERIVETIRDGVYTLDEGLTVRTVNDAMTRITGFDRETLVGSDPARLADEETMDRAAALTRELEAGDRDVATMTAEIRTADGGTVPVETRFSTYAFDEDSYRHVGVVRDVSDRRQFARTLAALHDSMQDLLRTETGEEVASVIAAAAETLGLSGATVYLFDRCENVLRPAAVGPDVGVDASALSVVGPGEGVVWDTFVEDADRTFGTDELYQSLSDHGVLYAGTREEDWDDRTRELVDLLTSSAEAALARVDRETALRERDAEHRRQNERLRQLKQVNELIRRVDRALVEADTREAIEQAVCDELTASNWFSFAWVGRVTEAGVDPTAWAGRSPSYLDAVTQSTAGDGGPPAVRTARSREPTVVPSVTDDLRASHWRTEAISRDFQSGISVPLAYDGYLYGVLTVYADQAGRFGDTLASVFAELGESIANATREIESRKRHPTDSVVELALAVAGPTPFTAQLAAHLGRSLTCEGVVASGEDASRLFLRVPDGDGSAVEPAIASMERVQSVSAISTGGRFEVVVEGETLARTLTDHGARVSALTADAEGAEVVVQVAPETDVRRFVEQVANRYGDVQLEARRERTTDQPNHGSIRGALESKLTDRQLEVLRTAYLSGFFEWPRETTGEEVAAMLDITQPTVNRHLRVSERKLLELVFEEQ